MNKPSDPDLEVFEHVRDTYAQIDPVPEDVLAAARGALGCGPAHAALRLVQRESEWGPRTCRLLRVHTSAAAMGGILSYGVLPSCSVRIWEVSPRHTCRRQQDALNYRLHQPDAGSAARGRIVGPDRRYGRG